MDDAWEQYASLFVPIYISLLYLVFGGMVSVVFSEC